LSDYFKPEFINRFDAIVEFNQLSKENLSRIVTLMLDDVNELLKDKEISVTVSQKAKDRLIDLGYDPSMGARPLRRVIQDQIEDQVAEFYLDNPKIKDLFVDADEEGNLMVVSKVDQPETTTSE
jgi:ATP-dependent Clp protease ATP-binding subunit ClpE